MAKKGKERYSHPRYDWTLIRKDYVEGWQNGEGRHLPTLKELAEKYHCNHSTIMRRSALDRWPDDRKMFARKVIESQERTAAGALAVFASRFDRQILSVAQEISAQVARCLLPYQPSDVGPPPLAPSLELQRLAAALKTAHEVAHAAIGDTPGIAFEDLGRDPRKRVLIHTVPKPPPGGASDDE